MSEGFRDDFKFYKRKDVFLNLSNVIDFNQVDNDQYCQQVSLMPESAYFFSFKIYFLFKALIAIFCFPI